MREPKEFSMVDFGLVFILGGRNLMIQLRGHRDDR